MHHDPHTRYIIEGNKVVALIFRPIVSRTNKP